jgi:hypothetical protein
MRWPPRPAAATAAAAAMDRIDTAPDAARRWYDSVAGAALAVLGVALVLAAATGGVLGAMAITLATARASSTQTLRVGARPALVLRGATGDVEVVAGGEGEVRVEARRQARAISARQAAAVLAQTEVAISQEGDTVSVETHAAGGAASGVSALGRESRVDLVVRVPAATEADVRVALGDLQVHGVEGPLRATVDSGDAHLDELRLSGASSVAVATGDATVAGALAPDATLDVRVSAGDARIYLPAGTAAVIDAQTALGHVDVRGWPVAVRESGSGQRGSGEVGDSRLGSAALRVRVSVGNVLVAARS